MKYALEDILIDSAEQSSTQGIATFYDLSWSRTHDFSSETSFYPFKEHFQNIFMSRTHLLNQSPATYCIGGYFISVNTKSWKPSSDYSLLDGNSFALCLNSHQEVNIGAYYPTVASWGSSLDVSPNTGSMYVGDKETKVATFNASKIKEKFFIVFFTNEIKNLSDTQKYAEGLQLIYNTVIDRIKDKDFNFVDSLIPVFIQNDIHLKLYVGFLAVTKGIENELLKRKDLLKAAYVAAEKVIQDKKRIKTILDGF